MKTRGYIMTTLTHIQEKKKMTLNDVIKNLEKLRSEYGEDVEVP